MITEAPLQTYFSALFFAPAKSLARQTFCGLLPKRLQQVAAPRSNWSPTILSLSCKFATKGSLLYSPDGKLLAATTGDEIRVWNAQTGVLLGKFGHPHESISSMVFLDGNVLVSGSGSIGSKSIVRFWNVKTGVGCGILELDDQGEICLNVASAGALLIPSGPLGGKITFWDARSGLPLRHIAVGTVEGRNLALSPDGQRLAFEAGDTIHVWNTKTGVLHVTRNFYLASVRKMTFSPNNHLLAALLSPNRILLWSESTGDIAKDLHYGKDFGAEDLAFSLDGQILVIAGSSCLVILRLETLTSQIYQCHAIDLHALALSPDGASVATMTASEVNTWNLNEELELRLSRELSDIFTHVAFAPDG
jgi:predicted Rdx family selenoprotein